MLKLSHAALITLAGSVWLAIGLFLLPLGLNLTLAAVKNPGLEVGHTPMLNQLALFQGSFESAAITIIAVCLFIGYFKGKYVLAKSVNRVIARIQTFPNPTSISNIFSKSYYLLIGIMICLGIMIRIFHVPNDIRGAIDIAIGAALINGSVLYFQKAAAMRKAPKAE
jgi:hypothetical protein